MDQLPGEKEEAVGQLTSEEEEGERSQAEAGLAHPGAGSGFYSESPGRPLEGSK